MKISRKKSLSTINALLALIDQSFSRKAWHGTNLRGSLRGLTAREAARRPARNRHSIAEIAIHCAYWKYIVRRRILGEKKGSFPLKGSNWFRRPEQLTEKQWRDDIRLLEQCHASMRDAVSRLKAHDLLLTPRGSTVSNLAIVMGIASHDVYHAGQIQLLKRLIP